MLNKIVNAIKSSGKQMLTLGNPSISQPTNVMQPQSQFPQQYPYNPGYQEYQIPQHLDPHINPSADWDYYRSLIASQEFARNQMQQLQQQYQQQAIYSQILDNMRSQRVEWEAQQLAGGASLEYYAKLNQAYQRGISGSNQK